MRVSAPIRLTLSLLAAVGLHGALFGVAAAVLSHGSAEHAAPVAVDVEVVEIVAPRPDPVADSAPAPIERAVQRPAAFTRAHAVVRSRQVALVGNPIPIDPTAASDAPGIPTAAPISATPAATAPAARVPSSAASSAGALLSAKPRYRSNPTPDYPLPSRRRREEGIVLLDVVVQADGTPSAIKLNRSCGHALLDRAALDAVRRWTFEPARAAGVAVSSLVVVPVRFSLADQP